MNLSQFIWYFSIYSLFGWIWETSYLFFKHKKFIDVGFLKGPFCPLYGINALLVIIFLSPLQHNLILFYILSIFIVTFCEYLTSKIIESIFKIKFWDYSDFKFNIKGRIALSVSLFWGILLIILIKFIHPQISFLIKNIPAKTLYTGATVLVLYFITDSIYTIFSLFGLKQILQKLEQLPSDLKIFHNCQLRLFKAFPKISSHKFNLIKGISQKINKKN
jgi:uncharacterized membrane protein